MRGDVRFELPEAVGNRSAGGLIEECARRRLSPEEIERLEAQGNVCSEWANVAVSSDFSPRHIHGCEFAGVCDIADNARLWHSTIVDTSIACGVVVRHCSLIRGYWICKNAKVEVSRLEHTGTTLFGNGVTIRPGVEVSTHAVRLVAEMDWSSTLEAIERMGEDPQPHAEYVENYCTRLRSDHGYVGNGATIVGASMIRSSFIGAGRTIEGPCTIENSTLLAETRVEGEPHPSSEIEKVATADDTIAAGAIIRDSLLHPYAFVADGGSCHQSMLFSGASVIERAHVHGSILGMRTCVAKGEVTVCVLGPLVGIHHRSLLIACMWPDGLGNVGAGAQVGSNHTSRLPDQGLRAGEGMFFGLSTAIKFPANYEESPHSVIATGLITGPQRVRFPFSLITLLDDPPPDAPSGYNRLVPGWMFSHNLFALLRNERKYALRRGIDRWETLVIREKTVAMVRDALQRLEQVDPPAQWYDDGRVDGVGKNVLLEADRRRAVSAYRDIIQYWELRSAIIERRRLDEGSVERYSDLIDRLKVRARDSRARDYHRGIRVFDDYGTTHPQPDDDPELNAVLAILDEENSAILRQSTKGVDGSQR